MQHQVAAGRLISLDALRGFNMFLIIGLERIADALSKLDLPGAQFLAGQLNHTQWNGFTFYDLIYPMFLYVAGISIAFAIGRRRERGESPRKILLYILKRTVWLFLAGLYMSNSRLGFYQWVTNLRWTGVLQRIALCYCMSAAMVLFVRPRYQVAIATIILIGYWLLARFVPVPGFGAGVWDVPEASFANYIDRMLMPGRLYYDTWDPEGLLSTFPALVTCMLGVLSGFWVRRHVDDRGKPVSREVKAKWLGLAGLILLGVGLLWGLDFPINKKIWSSSFTLVTSGLSAMMMALFYCIVDIWGCGKWAFPFVVIGTNSFFIYMVDNIFPFDRLFRRIIGSQLSQWFGQGQELIIAGLTIGTVWLLLYFMYRRKIFVRF